MAIVGARASTGYGEHVTGDLASGLVMAGVTVISGGAYGIDATAHRAALGSGGRTAAVLAGGVDRPYPSGNADLLSRIRERGPVISEVPCGSSPTKWRFLARNRLIAALADATVVVEAGWRSGSLNTAGHAAALGRPLGAVPGPITSATSAGCHRLLRDYDATCITSSEDILLLLGWQPGRVTGAGDDRVTDTTRVLDGLSTRSPRTVVEVARRSGLSTEDAAGILALLDLEGAVELTPDGWRRAGSRP